MAPGGASPILLLQRKMQTISDGLPTGARAVYNVHMLNHLLFKVILLVVPLLHCCCKGNADCQQWTSHQGLNNEMIDIVTHS